MTREYLSGNNCYTCKKCLFYFTLEACKCDKNIKPELQPYEVPESFEICVKLIFQTPLGRNFEAFHFYFFCKLTASWILWMEFRRSRTSPDFHFEDKGSRKRVLDSYIEGIGWDLCNGSGWDLWVKWYRLGLLSGMIWDFWAKCLWLPGCFLNGTLKDYKFLDLNANLNSCLLESN
ncbi:hypothetical protein RhiirA4_532280 [Rhizophagus irregularis]|uniref:Uncharacterized protein n=1 Tax=Rhizophagus irregularis TaxID=588596 RepID=A0A2I1GX29_9GLOM|nr:hypothetical protein RhiirA4_532280 [Rhizophagus irregularis]